jgi:hypothetical protein
VKTKEPFGMGELLRAATGRPYFTRLLRDLPELKILALAWAFMIVSAALVALLPSLLFSGAVIAAGLCLMAVASIHQTGNVKTGIYAMLVRLLQAIALPVGYLTPRRNPRSWIESRVLGEPDAEVSREADQQMEAYGADIARTAR